MLADLPPALVHCVEDMPCWTWSTMGDHKRGVMTVDGIRYVVGPCRFRRLYLSHRITLAGQRLRGDWHAINTACGETHIGTALTVSGGIA